jgi:hypothetical protein
LTWLSSEGIPAPLNPAVGRPAQPVESTEFVPAAGSGFEPAVLARIDGALAESIGPLSPGYWCGRPSRPRRTWRRCADSSRWPCPKPSKRRSVSGSAISPGCRNPRRRRQPAAPAPGGPGRPLSAAVLAEAAERLAVYIGPMAKVFVKRAAEQASGTRDLYERLARHIDDPSDRRLFAAATEELAEP